MTEPDVRVPLSVARAMAQVVERERDRVVAEANRLNALLEEMSRCPINDSKPPETKE